MAVVMLLRVSISGYGFLGFRVVVSRVFVCFCGLGFKVVGCRFNVDTVYGARSVWISDFRLVA